MGALQVIQNMDITGAVLSEGLPLCTPGYFDAKLQENHFMGRSHATGSGPTHVKRLVGQSRTAILRQRHGCHIPHGCLKPRINRGPEGELQNDGPLPDSRHRLFEQEKSQHFPSMPGSIPSHASGQWFIELTWGKGEP